MQPFQLMLLVVLAALWGASFLFMRVAVPEFGPFALIAVRVVSAALILLAVWYAREPVTSRHHALRHWKQLLVVGVFNSAIPFVLFAYSTLSITGGFASILNSTASVWTVLIAWLWLKRRPSTQTLFGSLLGIVGVAVLVGDSMGQNSAGLSPVQGALAAASAAIFYGFAANYSSEKLSQVSSLTVATFSLVAAALLLTPLAIVYAPSQPISLNAWSAVLAMGVFCTAIANIIYFYLLAAMGPTKTVTVAFLIPMFGTLWGVLFINETISLGMVVGGAVILAGIALVTNVIRLPNRA